jgi:hypothetical protein
MTPEQTEENVNDLIAIIWPRLDAGESQSDIRADIDNVFDSWMPSAQDHELIDTDDNPPRLVNLDAFIALNEFGPEEEQEIRALKVGAIYKGGGGAAPEWSIRRIR